MKLLFLLAGLCALGMAQSDSSKVSVDMPESVKTGLERYRFSPNKVYIYQVQLYNGDREGANKTQMDYLELDVGEPVYVIYNRPNFKVRCGDFTDYNDAKSFHHAIQEYFPDSYVIVSNL